MSDAPTVAVWCVEPVPLELDNVGAQAKKHGAAGDLAAEGLGVALRIPGHVPCCCFVGNGGMRYPI